MTVVERIFSPEWQKLLNSEQYNRVVSFGKWDTYHVDPESYDVKSEIQKKFAYKKKTEIAGIKSTDAKLPFTEEKVPNELVEFLALCNLREKGFPQF